MPLTSTKLRTVAKQYGKKIFLDVNGTADLGTDDIEAAVDAMVSFAENNTAAINNAFPEPFKSTATQEQKRFILALAFAELAGL